MYAMLAVLNHSSTFCNFPLLIVMLVSYDPDEANKYYTSSLSNVTTRTLVILPCDAAMNVGSL